MTALYQLSQLRYGYEKKAVLNIEQFEIQESRVTALLGSNGAGKSTLLKLLAFLDAPQQGSITFKGRKVDAAELLSFRRQVGLVAQKPYLLQGTVFDNMALGLKFRRLSTEMQKRQVENALERAGISHFAHRVANELSGGEAQKVALARALALQPAVLLLDEPFTHLDQGSIDDLDQLISDFASQDGKSVIFTTHDRLHASALADEVMGLVSGRVIYAPLLNLYRGQVEGGCFKTESISINLPADIQSGRQVAIDPTEIVLSKQSLCPEGISFVAATGHGKEKGKGKGKGKGKAIPLNSALTSSMRNSFQGRIVMIAEEKGRVRVTVEAGERFQVQITHQSLTELGLSLGEPAWVNFKSTSLQVL
jgi:tungstate transport system ATP-binding protein